MWIHCAMCGETLNGVEETGEYVNVDGQATCFDDAPHEPVLPSEACI